MQPYKAEGFLWWPETCFGTTKRCPVFFTTITTLGTPLDLTTQELRIESLFPADEDTKQFYEFEFVSETQLRP
jgi:hypothetical protein